jgi:DNA replication protein DnaC
MKTEEFEQWLSQQPKTRPCGEHPDQQTQLMAKATTEHHATNPWREPDAFYGTCPVCKAKREQRKLELSGTPPALFHCSFENWKPADGQEEQHLKDVREFAESVNRGFLILLGPVGIGKTHLAVSALRRMGQGVFVKQSSLLAQLRATYSDRNAKNPVPRCQAANILVLDEMGVSSGGKDEFPMIHEILDHRYNHLTPTIITSNLTWDELRAELGERLADRLREAAWKVLVFAGQSRRPTRRDDYFKAPEPPSQKLDIMPCF